MEMKGIMERIEVLNSFIVREGGTSRRKNRQYGRVTL